MRAVLLKKTGLFSKNGAVTDMETGFNGGATAPGVVVVRESDQGPENKTVLLRRS